MDRVPVEVFSGRPDLYRLRTVSKSYNEAFPSLKEKCTRYIEIEDLLEKNKPFAIFLSVPSGYGDIDYLSIYFFLNGECQVLSITHDFEADGYELFRDIVTIEYAVDAINDKIEHSGESFDNMSYETYYAHFDMFSVYDELTERGCPPSYIRNELEHLWENKNLPSQKLFKFAYYLALNMLRNDTIDAATLHQEIKQYLTNFVYYAGVYYTIDNIEVFNDALQKERDLIDDWWIENVDSL